MLSTTTLGHDLSSIAGVSVIFNAPLSLHTRFGIGGPARLYVEAAHEEAFINAVRVLRSTDAEYAVVGCGTNLVASDDGFEGVVLRLTEARITAEHGSVTVTAGTQLQQLVDFTIDQGLSGLHVMTGIPGSVGAAIYGNAGAYGRSISESVRLVRFWDGSEVRTLGNGDCEFAYRESVFKRNKKWVIFSSVLELDRAAPDELRSRAVAILDIRNRKYPQSMKCAGSIFKNLLLKELPPTVQIRVPEKVVIEGKVPSAWFLEQVGAKGMSDGDIRVADYHANLIYNAGNGTAVQLRRIIDELKRRVFEEFGFRLEEEVQFIGF